HEAIPYDPPNNASLMRAVVIHPPEYSCLLSLARSRNPMPKALAGGHPPHHPTVDWIVLGHHDGRGMRPGLEQPALVPEQCLQMIGLIRPDPAEHHELVTGRDHIGRVELQEA